MDNNRELTPDFVLVVCWEYIKVRTKKKYDDLAIEKVFKSVDDRELMQLYFITARDQYFNKLKEIIKDIDYKEFLKEFLAEDDIYYLFGLIDAYKEEFDKLKEEEKIGL
ncbi:hypothetical protein [Priestia koreensis]|uniref:hypothetical protein n=1 Tax=Priestia koreensis TaxID=284581 RepID=UPI003015F8BA